MSFTISNTPIRFLFRLRLQRSLHHTLPYGCNKGGSHFRGVKPTREQDGNRRERTGGADRTLLFHVGRGLARAPIRYNHSREPSGTTGARHDR